MEITESAAPNRIILKLDFLQPMQASNTAEFTLMRQANGTSVTWTMRGRSSYLMRVMGLVVNWDELAGKDFALGLNNLRTVVER